MRIGDVYKIARMIKEDRADKDIIDFFKNDYSAEETARFVKESHANIASEKALAKKVEKPTAKKSKKSDPLG